MEARTLLARVFDCENSKFTTQLTNRIQHRPLLPSLCRHRGENTMSWPTPRRKLNTLALPQQPISLADRIHMDKIHPQIRGDEKLPTRVCQGLVRVRSVLLRFWCGTAGEVVAEGLEGFLLGGEGEGKGC